MSDQARKEEFLALVDSLVSEHDQIKQQRDELLAALIRVTRVAELQGADIDEGSAVAEARAVIAKATS